MSTVRLQPEAIETGPGTRAVAAIQANAISFYFLFIPIPGVDLDDAINKMLVVTAKSMGADKVVGLEFDVTPSGGVWALRKLFGWRSARASGIAVQLDGPRADPGAQDGPEAPITPSTGPEGGADEGGVTPPTDPS